MIDGPLNLDELPDWVMPGVSFVYDFGPDNRRTGRKFHVRAIVDDLAVIREWSRTESRWEYTVEGPEYFDAYRHRIKPVKT